MDNKELLQTAYTIASYSPDPSTQIGAFLVSHFGRLENLTMAFNCPSHGHTMTAEDWEAPRKYAILEHAERGALYKAARQGISTSGGTLVSSWAACADCARAMVACGISVLVRHVPPPDEASARWAESVELGDSLLRAGGVDIVDVVGPIPGAPKILRSGEWYDPAN